MDGFGFTILLFFAFVFMMFIVISAAKGKRRVYLIAVFSTLSAWFIGLLLDANIDMEPVGFLSFRTLLPVLAMGLCILKAIMKDKAD